MLARLWTHGWDVWAPGPDTPQPVFTQWARSERVHSYQSDAQAAGLWPAYVAQRRESQAAVKAVLRGGCDDCCAARLRLAAAAGSDTKDAPGTSSSGACFCDHMLPQWRPGGDWGLGTQRGLADFVAHVGVDFVRGQISDKSAWGGLSPEDFE